MTSLHITSLHVCGDAPSQKSQAQVIVSVHELVRLQALNAATTQLTQRHRHADTHVCFVHHLRPSRATAQRSRSVVILHTPTDYYKNPSSLVGYADSVSISPSTQEWDTFAHYGLGQCG